jgi:hypothetical protein
VNLTALQQKILFFVFIVLFIFSFIFAILVQLNWPEGHLLNVDATVKTSLFSVAIASLITSVISMFRRQFLGEITIALNFPDDNEPQNFSVCEFELRRANGKNKTGTLPVRIEGKPVVTAPVMGGNDTLILRVKEGGKVWIAMPNPYYNQADFELEG